MIASSLLGQLQRAFRSTPGVAMRVKQEPMEDPPPVEDQEETLVGGHNGEHNEEEEEDDVVTNEEVANHNGSEGQSPGEDDGFLFEIRFEGREGQQYSTDEKHIETSGGDNDSYLYKQTSQPLRDIKRPQQYGFKPHHGNTGQLDTGA